MSLGISLREQGDITIIELDGNLELPDCQRVRVQVKEELAAGKKKLAIALNKVERIDADGLAMLAASFVSVQHAARP